MGKCFICGKYFEDKDENSVEHIIPQAIGGHLKSYILCKKHNGDFGHSDGDIASDESFCAIFKNIIEELNKNYELIKFDRGRKPVNETGYLYQSKNLDSPKIEVIRDKNTSKVYPVSKEPIIDEQNKKVIIYADKKIGRQLEQKARKMLGDKANDYTYEITDIDFGYLALFFSENNADFNREFKSGLVKIATEFAIAEGIDPELLDGVLKFDEKDNEYHFQIVDVIVIPYYPCSYAEECFEQSRPELEEGYPSHFIKLFTANYEGDKKFLYCYVELFSTFQYYVVLSDNYVGNDIDVNYSQKLIDKNDGYVPDYDQMDPSDLDICIREHGCASDILEKTMSEIIAELKRLDSQTAKYHYDYEKMLACVFERIAYKEMQLFAKGHSVFMNDPRALSLYMQDIELFYKKIANYKKGYKDPKNIQQYYCPDKCIDVYLKNKEEFEKYTQMKFKQLNKYISKI